MDLKYLRFKVFKSLMRPFSERARRRRMKNFVERMHLAPGMTVLDLGGQPMIWDSLPTPLDITILNLPGVAETDVASHHRIRYVVGDGCHVEGFSNRQFDTVFSNSVIEHVGPPEKQAEFAREVRRLGKSYWVQTPSIWFPVEAHCGMPFWWFYPPGVRRHFLERWRRKLPGWSSMVEGTRVLRRTDFAKLFPEATIWVETVLGVPKSYVAYFTGPEQAG
jgi:hypothetical protein